MIISTAAVLVLGVVVVGVFSGIVMRSGVVRRRGLASDTGRRGRAEHGRRHCTPGGKQHGQENEHPDAKPPHEAKSKPCPHDRVKCGLATWCGTSTEI